MGVVKGALDHYGPRLQRSRGVRPLGSCLRHQHPRGDCAEQPLLLAHFRGSSNCCRTWVSIREELGTLPPNAHKDDRVSLEMRVRDCLDEGTICSILCLDHQLVLGYDDARFHPCPALGRPRRRHHARADELRLVARVRVWSTGDLLPVHARRTPPGVRCRRRRAWTSPSRPGGRARSSPRKGTASGPTPMATGSPASTQDTPASTATGGTRWSGASARERAGDYFQAIAALGIRRRRRSAARARVGRGLPGSRQAAVAGFRQDRGRCRQAADSSNKPGDLDARCTETHSLSRAHR